MAARGRLGTHVLLVAALVLPTACTGSSTNHAGPPVVRTARLAPVPLGTASVRLDAKTGVASAHIELTGLALGSRHGVTLGHGTCAEPGAQIVAFRPLVTSQAGVALGTVTSTKKLGSIPGGAQLSVTAGPGSSAADRARIACADIRSGAAAPMTAVAKVSGTVTLSWAGGKLTAHVQATGLVPHTVHALHVHFGTCASQSGVEVALGDVTADAAGNVDSMHHTTLKSALTATGWYVDIHDGPSSSLVGASGQPSLALRPLACGGPAGT